MFPSPQTPRQIQKMSPQHASVKGNLHDMRSGLRITWILHPVFPGAEGATMGIWANWASQEVGRRVCLGLAGEEGAPKVVRGWRVATERAGPTLAPGA